jgi:predicted nucleotidyltransferase
MLRLLHAKKYFSDTLSGCPHSPSLVISVTTRSREYTETMTMRITKQQKIGGVSALDTRKLLRKYHERFRKDWLEEALSELLFRRKFGHGDLCFYPEEDRALRRKAAPLIADLLQKGFIEKDEEETQKERRARHNLSGKEWYKFTERGHELCNATAARPVHRKSADEALQGLMERALTVNEDDRFLYRITAVVLYGSYLRGADRLADVDLAIEVERKIEDFGKFHEACWKHLHDSGRTYQRVGYEIDFPRDAVFVFLKQRKRTLSLHSLYDFITMEKHENFSYEVLLGDKDAIAQKLEEAVNLR